MVTRVTSMFDYIHGAQDNANAVHAELSTVPGLKPVMPAGAMYMMVGIDLEHYPLLTSAVDLMEQLMSEQSVFCLPGEVCEHPT